ncbi:multicopper oxidase-domain-containing protein [Aspergillus ambiguus]|uniref:multicopper oxidase n=1 Tax=Aspergillus ambiguus TaxID=176160 RepID=UPI003CCE1919
MGRFQQMLGLSTLLLCLVSCTEAQDQLTRRSTGNTVRFEAILTWENWAPAGIARKMILTNGQFPAPPLELRQGDDVEFLVINKLPVAATVHFHGIVQSGTPWSDGVPGLSQRPIQPGDQFLYKWRATQYGSYFYHAHHRGQIEDGLYGAIYIHPHDSVEKPFSLITNNTDELQAMRAAESKTRPVMLSDWRQLTSGELWAAEEATGLDAYCANSLLINGKGSIDCLSQKQLNKFTTAAQRSILGNSSFTDIGCLPPTNRLGQGDFPHNLSAIVPSMYYDCTPSRGLSERFLVDPTTSYVSFDLISAASVSTFVFSVDEHPMYVYAVDGRYVVPTLVDAITLSNGNRYSVMIKLDKPAGDYTVRLATTGANQILATTATMSYNTSVVTMKEQKASVPYIDIAGTLLSSDYTALNESTITPFPAEIPSHDVAQTHVLDVGHYHASYRWTLGNASLPMILEETTPLLFDPSAAERNLSIKTLNGTWVDLIFRVGTPLQPPHPFHKHSNKFFVIGQGNGLWNYASVAEAVKYIPESFNFRTPQIRDTYYTPPASTGPTWLAIRYQVVNPGPFLLHCHVQVHLNGGMGLTLMDGVDEWPEVPAEYQW